MTTAKELLHFTYDPVDFAIRGVDLVEPGTVRAVERATAALAGLARHQSTYRREEPADVAEIYRRFVTTAELGPDTLAEAFADRRDVRKLAWSLCYREGDRPAIAHGLHLPYALTILSDDRSSVRLGTFEALLRVWDDPANADRLRSHLGPWFLGYDGRRRDVLTVKENAAYFFERSGGARLGGALVHAGRPLTDAWDVLGLPEHTRAFAYFSDVAVSYTQATLRARRGPGAIGSVLDFLEAHGRSDVSRRCLAPIVVALEEAPDDALRNRVQAFCFEVIGDPAKDHLWQPWPGATEHEAAELKRAQSILNRWIVQRFIVAFFDKVTIDRDRREFWLPYASEVSRFKVFSDRDTLRKLHADERLRPFIKERFSVVYGNVSALMMQVRSKRIVEFSETGNACYVYDTTNPAAPDFDRRYRSIGDLRQTNMPLLFNFRGGYIFNKLPQGRLSHQPGWQGRMRTWMREFVRV